jgi:5'-nucleotidase
MTALPLAGKRLLLSNDDGIHAPGLTVLEKIARKLSKTICICAPELEQSGAGHSLTLRRPLRLHKLKANRFYVDGTPTDAVLLAMKKLREAQGVDLVLSGVNAGGNLGEDVTYSGTVAAAMEGTLVGVPAIALSQERLSGQPIHWRTAETFGPEVIAKVFSLNFPSNILININFPNLPPDAVKGVKVTRQGQRKIGDQVEERRDLRGERYYWIGALRNEPDGQAGSDLEAVANGFISVTPMHLDLTHHGSLSAMERLFS